jgi:serine/threonine protein kinase
MASQAVDQLLGQAQRAGLFSADASRDLIAQMAIATETEALTTDQVAERLIERKLLTRYQADQLLAGRGDECTVAGRYRVVDKLGEGGMGAVYKAHDMKLDRDVAVKVLPAQSLADADAITRFQREARALAKLSHPNIIQAFDSGEDRGRYFLVMEYVEGASLAAILSDHGAITPTLAADMTYQAAIGLQHAHDKGLVHRDVKPGNLLWLLAQPLADRTTSATSEQARSSSDLTKSYSPPALPGKGILKILDLGLARFLQDQLGDSQVTQEGTGVGTPDYMAPEQFRDALHADARTDIYGLGCTLYQLISGTVPFPGSSFSEKAHAHAKQQPIPLEERCPDVPAGLSFVVAKMMAKHPADRFQSAAEVAEALAPYVAGQSHSMILLRQTMRFHAGQLTTKTPNRRKRVLAWAGAAIAAACFSRLLIVEWRSIFPTGSGDPALNAQGATPGTPSPEPTPPAVITIENGLTVAKDGTGQFTTITEALDQVKPGQTIRVLDDAVYRESLSIGSPTRHFDIRLEAPRSATVESSAPRRSAVSILAVPGVTLRGFRLRAGATQQTLVDVRGNCSGLELDGLDMSPGAGTDYDGVLLAGVAIPEHARPVIVQRCRLRRPHIGVQLLAVAADFSTPTPCSRIIVRDNLIVSSGGYGISLRGLTRQVHVVGNRITGGTNYSAIQMDAVLEGSEDVLIANNTIFECTPAFRVWDDAVRGKNIQVRNNLVLGAAGPDMDFLERRGNDFQYAAPSEGSLITKGWELGQNWREVGRPNSADATARAWIPPSATDVIKDRIDVLSRDPAHTDFLRPGNDSPLATGGAGGNLPSYIGAVAPEAVAPWDWQWTWDAHVGKLLTVSKHSKDGGRFRTLGAALQAVSPGMTIRVVDQATYSETVEISDAAKHEGIVLEAPEGATLEMTAGLPGVILLRDVPNVRIKGFRLRATGETGAFVTVASQAGGVVLESLDIQTTSRIHGIVLRNVSARNAVNPATIRKCSIHVGYDGIEVIGPPGVGGVASQGIRIHDNRIAAALRGVHMQGTLADLHVTGNIMWNCVQEGIGFSDVAAASEKILVANNTVFNAGSCFRLWDDPPYEQLVQDQVEVANNLCFESELADMAFVQPRGDDRPGYPSMGDDDALQKVWRFRHNWRDVSGGSGKQMQLAGGDRRLERIEVLSRDPSNAGFMKPPADSILATGGAGGDLPTYAGALPPDGFEPWDWESTWKARMRKPESEKD